MRDSGPLDLSADIVDLTSRLIDVPSESRHEGELAELVETALRDCPHLEVTRIGDNVVARTQAGRPTRVVLAGHLDTVPAAGNERARLVPAGGTSPVAASGLPDPLPEAMLFGLGSCDMKGGVAVALRAAYALSAPRRDVTYVFYAREEIDAAHSGLQEVMDAAPTLLADADFAVLLEPSDGGIEAGCQGTLRAEVVARGTRAHSARSWMGDNAVHSAGELLARLQTYEPAQVNVDGLVYREGLNAVAIRGGVAGNVIPDECVVTVNYRFAPVQDLAGAEAHLREVFEGFEVTIVDSAPGAVPGLRSSVVQELVSAVGSEPRPKFGWTDVARFSAMGVPAVNFGPGDPSWAHTAAEHVPVAQLRSVDTAVQNWLR